MVPSYQPIVHKCRTQMCGSWHPWIQLCCSFVCVWYVCVRAE